MPAACALGIISGKIIFNFEIAERLRTLRYLIFTGGVCLLPLKRKVCGYARVSLSGGSWQSRQALTEGVKAKQRPKGFAYFPTKSGLMGGTKQCIVRKKWVYLLQNGGKRAIL